MNTKRLWLIVLPIVILVLVLVASVGVQGQSEAIVRPPWTPPPPEFHPTPDPPIVEMEPEPPFPSTAPRGRERPYPTPPPEPVAPIEGVSPEPEMRVGEDSMLYVGPEKPPHRVPTPPTPPAGWTPKPPPKVLPGEGLLFPPRPQSLLNPEEPLHVLPSDDFTCDPTTGWCRWGGMFGQDYQPHYGVYASGRVLAEVYDIPPYLRFRDSVVWVTSTRGAYAGQCNSQSQYWWIETGIRYEPNAGAGEWRKFVGSNIYGHNPTPQDPDWPEYWGTDRPTVLDGDPCTMGFWDTETIGTYWNGNPREFSIFRDTSQGSNMWTIRQELQGGGTIDYDSLNMGVDQATWFVTMQGEISHNENSPNDLSDFWMEVGGSGDQMDSWGAYYTCRDHGSCLVAATDPDRITWDNEIAGTFKSYYYTFDHSYSAQWGDKTHHVQITGPNTTYNTTGTWCPHGGPLAPPSLCSSIVAPTQDQYGVEAPLRIRIPTSQIPLSERGDGQIQFFIRTYHDINGMCSGTPTDGFIDAGMGYHSDTPWPGWWTFYRTNIDTDGSIMCNSVRFGWFNRITADETPNTWFYIWRDTSQGDHMWTVEYTLGGPPITMENIYAPSQTGDHSYEFLTRAVVFVSSEHTDFTAPDDVMSGWLSYYTQRDRGGWRFLNRDVLTFHEVHNDLILLNYYPLQGFGYDGGSNGFDNSDYFQFHGPQDVY